MTTSRIFTSMALLVLGGIYSAIARGDDSSATNLNEKSYPITTDVTWASAYIMDGFSIGGDHPVFQPSVRVGMPLTGVSLMFWSSLQVDRSNQQYDELDLMARYSHDFVTSHGTSLNLHGYYDYWTYPKLNVPTNVSPGSSAEAPSSMRGSKVNAGVSATNLIPLGGSFLVPSYNLYYWIYWAQNSIDQWQGGAHHEFLLEYYHSIPKLSDGIQYQYVGASGSINYNDGAFGTQSAWSHSTASVSTGVYALSCIFSLSLNRQWAFETATPSVDMKNELWTTLSLTKAF
jgi:hypothetical protein